MLMTLGVFFSAASSKKNTKNGAAVTSLRSFLFCDDFIKHSIWGFCLNYFYFLVIGSFREAATLTALHTVESILRGFGVQSEYI